MSSLQGHLLIARPELRDPNFGKSVVLLVQHSEDGALGLILNRPLKVAVREACEQMGDFPCNTDQMLHMGGPVDGPLMTLHCRGILSEIRVIKNLHFSVQPQNIRQIVERPEEKERFFVGFAGWSGGQLESEIEEGSWDTLPATLDHVFSVEGDLWAKVRKQVADAKLRATLGIKHAPRDPSMN